MPFLRRKKLTILDFCIILTTQSTLLNPRVQNVKLDDFISLLDLDLPCAVLVAEKCQVNSTFGSYHFLPGGGGRLSVIRGRQFSAPLTPRQILLAPLLAYVKKWPPFGSRIFFGPPAVRIPLLKIITNLHIKI